MVIVVALDTGDQTGSVYPGKILAVSWITPHHELHSREADRGAQGGVEIEGIKKRQHDATQSRR